jgi:hypothetical protein
MNTLTTLTLDSPVGCLALRARDDNIVALDWVDAMTPRPNIPVLT